MADLQPMNVVSATEPMELSPVFDAYDKDAQAYNQKRVTNLAQQGVEFVARNPELVAMTLA